MFQWIDLFSLYVLMMLRCYPSLRTADAFPVVASLPPKNSYFSEGEKRRPEMRLRFAGYYYPGYNRFFLSCGGNLRCRPKANRNWKPRKKSPGYPVVVEWSQLTNINKVEEPLKPVFLEVITERNYRIKLDKLRRERQTVKFVLFVPWLNKNCWLL